MSQVVLVGGSAETAARAEERMRVAAEMPVGPRKAGVLIFLGSESILFLTFIVQYVQSQAHPTGPTPHDSLNVLKTLGFSVALWASSATMQLAPHAIRHGRQRMARLWLWLTIALGGTFVYGEVSEWLDLFSKNITGSRNIWASTYFSLTGLHGLHVIFGLALMLGLLGFGHKLPFSRSGDSGLEILTIYWHFVDGMWVLIFGIVYFWSAVLL